MLSMQKTKNDLSLLFGDMKTRILLTGTNGFVGQSVLEHIVHSFPAEGYEFLCLVRSRPVRSYENVDFIYCDLNDELPYQVKNFDPHIIIHLAALLKGGTSKEYWEVNVLGTQQLLESAGASLELFIYGSSMSVYGQGPFNKGVKENAPLGAQTSLAKSRASAEQRIEEFCRQKSVGCFLLRPRFIFGARDNSTLPSLLKISLSRLRIGNEQQKFSYIHVDDYARIICNLCELKGQMTRCEALNVCYSAPIQMSHLLELLSPKRQKRWPIYLPVKMLIRVLSLFQRSSLLTKLELVGQDQILSQQKLETYIEPAPLINKEHEKLKSAIQKYLEFAQ